MKKITAYFFQGLLFLMPLVVTVYILYFVISKVDQILVFSIPGMGILVTLVVITLIGFLVSTVLARGAATFIDSLFRRMPVIKMIYSSVKDLVGAFVGEKKRFDRPVLVDLAAKGAVQVLGFITRDSLSTFGAAEHVAVYVPQSFNFAGNVLIVRQDHVTPLAIESGKAMAFIVSGGVSGS